MGNNPTDMAAARQEIRRLLSEIGQLSSEGALPPKDYFTRFLANVVAALAATGGAVWLRTSSGDLKLLCDRGLDRSGLGKDRAVHGDLLRRALAEGQRATAAVQPDARPSSEADSARPLLLLMPLQSEIGSAGLLEVFQRRVSNDQLVRGWVAVLECASSYASSYLNRRVVGQLKRENARINSQIRRFQEQAGSGSAN